MLLLERTRCTIDDLHASKIVTSLIDLVHGLSKFFVNDFHDSLISNGSFAIVRLERVGAHKVRADLCILDIVFHEVLDNGLGVIPKRRFVCK